MTDGLLLGGRGKVKVAVVQAAPVFLDKHKTVEKARELMAEASSQSSDLIVFPEAWISAYPYWSPVALGEDDSYKYSRVISMFHDNSIHIPGEETERLCDAARKHHLHVVIGCNELSDIPGSRTIYNTLLFLDDEGQILGKHRKLIPTHEERLIWGMGDGSDLDVYPTKIGRIGGLICWENHMPLTRAAMIMKGEEFHVAVWPGSWHTGKRLSEPDTEGRYCDLFPAIREHAFEAGAFVISVSPNISRDEIPSDFPYRNSMNIDWACGGSAIVGPSGNYVVEPTFGPKPLITAECEADAIKVAKAFFDSLGHYARFDVARIHLRQERWQPFTRSTPQLTRQELAKLSTKHGVDIEKLEQIYNELLKSQSNSLK